ncbi:MAG: hypothetical protein AB7O04_08930 [Hyphomonadaceae bacterium]
MQQMFRKTAVSMAMALALMAGACDRQAADGGGTEAPKMDSPMPESEPARAFTPADDNSRTLTGRLTLTLTTRMAGAGEANGPTEFLTLRAETGLSIDAELATAAAPSETVSGQTIRALMDLPVEASQALVYRITEEQAPGAGRGLCGERAATHIAVWEPEDSAQSGLKLLALHGGAPGEAAAESCAALTYARADGT